MPKMSQVEQAAQTVPFAGQQQTAARIVAEMRRTGPAECRGLVKRLAVTLGESEADIRQALALIPLALDSQGVDLQYGKLARLGFPADRADG